MMDKLKQLVRRKPAPPVGPKPPKYDPSMSRKFRNGRDVTQER